MKQLKSVVTDEKGVTVTFSIAHNDNVTTVEQELVLRKTVEGWTARMEMVNFPNQSTITQSAHKLAEWFERMAQEIKSHEYDSLEFDGCDNFFYKF